MRLVCRILPWLVPLLVALPAITCVPQVTLWLPHAMGMLK
jgi:TRAP-type C4-dicarboxylate transport system permease large subunit